MDNKLKVVKDFATEHCVSAVFEGRGTRYNVFIIYSEEGGWCVISELFRVAFPLSRDWYWNYEQMPLDGLCYGEVDDDLREHFQHLARAITKVRNEAFAELDKQQDAMMERSFMKALTAYASATDRG